MVAWWLVLVQSILVRYVKVKLEWVERVRAAAEKGPVCFVLRNRSLIDFLCLRGLCRKHRLPPVSFVSGLTPFSYLPFLFWLLSLFRKRSPEALCRRLQDAFRGGGSAVVFLRRPSVRRAMGSLPVAVDGVHLAVKAQAALGLPVQALPTVFLWGESPMKRFPGAMDFIFGSNEYPRLLRSIWLLLWRRSVHELQVAEPLDLSQIKAERGIAGKVLTGVVRAGVGRQIELIRREKLGSLTKPSTRVITEVAKSGRLRGQLEAVAEAEGIPKAEIASRTKSILTKLAADFRPRIVALFAIVMMFVWKRIYTGIDVRNIDIERLRKAVAAGTALLLPTHKSHVDYLVLSHVMRENNLMLPHIAAGQNLSFWPLGWLFRSSGAFFIRRSFINDRFYTAVVSAYIRRLVQEGYAIEIFIEGGRSRTGKLLRPRTGGLDMSLKALALVPRATITVVPIFIGYEHVIEENAYVAESEGRPKISENIKGLLKTSTVLFRRYGRLYVRVNEPFAIDDLLREKEMTRDDLMSDSVRRNVAREVAVRTLAEINRMTIVTPSSILSTALLTHNGARISHDTLVRRALFLMEVMKAAGAPLSPLVSRWKARDDGDGGVLEQSIRVFFKVGRIAVSKVNGETRYRIRDGQRLPLDYYKNNTIHFLAPLALVAATLRHLPNQRASEAEIRREVALGCTLYQWEFMFCDCLLAGEGENGGAVARLVDRAVSILVELGLLAMEGDEVRVVDASANDFLADILRNFHEVYLAAVQGAMTRFLNGGQDPASKIAQSLTEKLLASKTFLKPEGHSELNRKSAMNTLKELKLTRPAKGEDPFRNGEMGDALYKYLKAVTGVG